MHHVYQIGGCQCNRRKGIPTTGLHADTYILAQLVVNRRNLRLAGSNGHGCIRVNLLNLAIDTLYHRLIGTIFLLENLDKLLRTNVVGQGPQTLTGATGQKNNIHK